MTPDSVAKRYDKIFDTVDKFTKSVEKQIKDLEDGNYPGDLWHEGSKYRIVELLGMSINQVLDELREINRRTKMDAEEALKLYRRK